MEEQDLNCSGEKSYYPIMADFATKVTKIRRICAESLLKKRKCLKIKHFKLAFVGVTGFEPATPWSQTRCATGLRYTPNAIPFQNCGAKV